MTARPIVTGRAYNVDGVAIIADHPASAIIECIRIMAAHQIGLAIRLRTTNKENKNVQNPQGTDFYAARAAAQPQPKPLTTAQPA